MLTKFSMMAIKSLLFNPKDVGLKKFICTGRFLPNDCKIRADFPLTSDSFGKCYLAFVEEDRRKEIIQKVNFKQFTDKSITDYETFTNSLNEVREKGYAVSYEEHTSGVFGVAAPIFNPYGNITMVIACIGFAHGVNDDFISFCGDKLKEASRRFMEVYGGREPIFDKH